MASVVEPAQDLPSVPAATGSIPSRPGDNVPLVLKVFDAAGRVADTNLPQLVGVP